MSAPSLSRKEITAMLRAWGDGKQTASDELVRAVYGELRRQARYQLRRERPRFTWTPDGRIVMASDIAGSPDIWIMNADGGGRKQLTNDPGADAQPAVSVDGKYIAFISNRAKGVDHIFWMGIDGSNVKQLTQGQQEVLPSFSPDGKWVYYVEIASKTVRRVAIDGGEPTVVATAPDGWELLGIDVNKVDGRLVYGLRKRLSNAWQYKVGILPVGGEAELIDVPANLAAGRPRWAPDNRTIALLSTVTVKGESPEIWTIPVDGKGSPRQVTNFGTPATYGGFSWSSDGKQLLVSRGTLMMYPVLIRNNGN